MRNAINRFGQECNKHGFGQEQSRASTGTSFWTNPTFRNLSSLVSSLVNLTTIVFSKVNITSVLNVIKETGPKILIIDTLLSRIN